MAIYEMLCEELDTIISENETKIDGIFQDAFDANADGIQTYAGCCATEYEPAEGAEYEVYGYTEYSEEVLAELTALVGDIFGVEADDTEIVEFIADYIDEFAGCGDHPVSDRQYDELVVEMIREGRI